jgi:hypothetical protein
MRSPSTSGVAAASGAADVDIPYYDGTILRFDCTRGWYPVHVGSVAQITTTTSGFSAAPEAALLHIPQSSITKSCDLVALDWDNVRREAMTVTKAILERERERRAEHAARAKAFQRWMSVRDKNHNKTEKRACDSTEGLDEPPRQCI